MGEVGAEAGEALGEDLEECGRSAFALRGYGVTGGGLFQVLHGGACAGEGCFYGLGSVLCDVGVDLGRAYVAVSK